MYYHVPTVGSDHTSIVTAGSIIIGAAAVVANLSLIVFTRMSSFATSSTNISSIVCARMIPLAASISNHCRVITAHITAPIAGHHCKYALRKFRQRDNNHREKATGTQYVPTVGSDHTSIVTAGRIIIGAAAFVSNHSLIVLARMNSNTTVMTNCARDVLARMTPHA